MTKVLGRLVWVPLLLGSQVTSETREQQKKATKVDLRRVDFSDQDEAATHAMGPLMEDLDRRLFQLFEKTETAECREKIAEHYGYFTKAFGLEKPMPFSEMGHFNNTCDDEHPWDFNNLPEGVVSHTSKCHLAVTLKDFLDSHVRTCSTWVSFKIVPTSRPVTKVNTLTLVRLSSVMEFWRMIVHQRRYD